MREREGTATQQKGGVVRDLRRRRLPLVRFGRFSPLFPLFVSGLLLMLTRFGHRGT